MNKYSDIKLRQSVLNFHTLPSITTRTVSDESYESIAKLSSTISLSKDSFKISNFSLLENSKMQNLTDRISLTPKHSLQSIKLPETSPPNFKSLIDKLDQIAEKPNFNRSKIIKPGKEYESQLLAGNFSYFNIDCKNKKSPMNIFVKRKSGLVKFFVSKNKNWPNEDNFDSCFIADFFEVCEKNSWFQETYYFMSALALENSKFTLFITFGKTKNFEKANNPLFDSLNYDESRYNLAQRVENIKKKRKLKALQLANSKNFIELNKCPTSPINKIHQWSDRQKSVVKKKFQNLNEKKIKAKQSVTKKIQRMEKLENDKKEMKLKPKLQKSQKSWIQLVCIAKSLLSIKNLIQASKRSKLMKIKTAFAIRRIQRQFRRYLQFSNPQRIALMNCRRNLIFMHDMLFSYMKKKQVQPLAAFFKSAYLNLKAQKAFCTYVNRVIFVQFQVKKFLKKAKTRFLSVVRVWNEVLSKLIVENAKEKPNVYTKITPQFRDPIIKRYLNDCVKIHEKRLRIYLSAYSVGAKCRKSFVLKKSALYPKYNYSPDEETMKSMINEALENMLNHNNN